MFNNPDRVTCDDRETVDVCHCLALSSLSASSPLDGNAQSMSSRTRTPRGGRSETKWAREASSNLDSTQAYQQEIISHQKVHTIWTIKRAHRSLAPTLPPTLVCLISLTRETHRMSDSLQYKSLKLDEGVRQEFLSKHLPLTFPCSRWPMKQVTSAMRNSCTDIPIGLS